MLEKIGTTECAKQLQISPEKLKVWLLKGCPFGYGFQDKNGNFLPIIPKATFIRWLEENGGVYEGETSEEEN